MLTESGSYFISLLRSFRNTTFRNKYPCFLKKFHTVMFVDWQISSLLMLAAISAQNLHLKGRNPLNIASAVKNNSYIALKNRLIPAVKASREISSYLRVASENSLKREMRQPSLFSSRLSDAQAHTWSMSAVNCNGGAELANGVARVLIVAVMTYSREWTACEIFVCAFVLTNLNPRWRPLVLSKDLVWASQTSIHKTANRER